MARKRLKHQVIAIEEHFMHPELTDHFPPGALHQPDTIRQRLYDFAGIRLDEMDAAGVDMQVLSHQSPGSQRLPADVAAAACRASNDALAAVIAEVPDRFAGFAMIPTTAPDAAADELQRSVEELGLKGALVHGTTNGTFIDDRAFWPVFARAESLGVPVYLHPAMPDREVIKRYYAPYDESHSAFVRSAWGFGVETGTQAARLILSGVFEEHPDLKVLLGHLGEGIPFLLPRIDESLTRPGNAPTRFAETFLRNFWITTSGFFADESLRFCLEVMPRDRVLFAIDWPYMDNAEGVAWLDAMEMDEDLKDDLFSGNAKKLLGL
jgi:predicted TIM-barrel fold metal-dependent hydrolase